MGKDIKFITNDLSDESTKSESQKVLESNGIADLINGLDRTGIITIIDAKNKTIIETISISKSSEDLQAKLNDALTLK